MEEEGRRRGRDPRCLFWISRTHRRTHRHRQEREEQTETKCNQRAISRRDGVVLYHGVLRSTTEAFCAALCVWGGGAAGVQRGCLLCIIQPSVNTTHKQPVNAPSKDSELPLPLRFSSSTSLHFHQCLHVNVRSSFCIIQATKGTYLL